MKNRITASSCFYGYACLFLIYLDLNNLTHKMCAINHNLFLLITYKNTDNDNLVLISSNIHQS